MDYPQSEDDKQDKLGLIAGIFGIARNLLGLILNRFELALIELSELGNHIAKFVFIVALAMVALWFFLAFGTIVVVYLAWQVWGWKTLLFFAILFAVITLALGIYALRMIKNGDLSMTITSEELQKDKETLL